MLAVNAFVIGSLLTVQVTWLAGASGRGYRARICDRSFLARHASNESNPNALSHLLSGQRDARSLNSVGQRSWVTMFATTSVERRSRWYTSSIVSLPASQWVPQQRHL